MSLFFEDPMASISFYSSFENPREPVLTQSLETKLTEILERLSIFDLEKGVYSFDDAYKIALNRLDEIRSELSDIIAEDTRRYKQKILRVYVLPAVIASIAFFTIGIIFFPLTTSFNINIKAASLTSYTSTIFGIALIIFASAKIFERSSYQSIFKNEFYLVEKQITTLKSDFSINFLKKEENRNFYPLLTNFEFGNFLEMEKKSALSPNSYTMEKNVIRNTLS